MQYIQRANFPNHNDRGVSLVEILLVIASVSFLMLLMANIPNSISLIGQVKRVSLALQIAQKQIEDRRNVVFLNLANGTSAITDSRIHSLPEGGGSVLIDDCGPLICTQSEVAKQISVTVSWKESGKDKDVKLQTLISEGGLNQ